MERRSDSKDTRSRLRNEVEVIIHSITENPAEKKAQRNENRWDDGWAEKAKSLVSCMNKDTDTASLSPPHYHPFHASVTLNIYLSLCLNLRRLTFSICIVLLSQCVHTTMAFHQPLSFLMWESESWLKTSNTYIYRERSWIIKSEFMYRVLLTFLLFSLFNPSDSLIWAFNPTTHQT